MTVLLFFLVQGYAKLVSRYERTRLITRRHLDLYRLPRRVLGPEPARCPLPRLCLLRVGRHLQRHGGHAVLVVRQRRLLATRPVSVSSPWSASAAPSGAFVGSDIADRLLRFVDVYELLLLAAGLLVICIVITNLISLKVWGRQQIRSARPSLTDWLSERKAQKEREKLALGLLREHKYLWYIALLVLTLNLVNTNGEFILGRLVENYAQIKPRSRSPRRQRPGPLSESATLISATRAQKSLAPVTSSR